MEKRNRNAIHSRGQHGHYFTTRVIDADLKPGDIVCPRYDWGHWICVATKYLNTRWKSNTSAAYKDGESFGLGSPPIFPGSYTRQIYWWIMKQGFKSDTRFEETQQHLTSNSTPRQIRVHRNFRACRLKLRLGSVIPEYSSRMLTSFLTLTITTVISVLLIRHKWKLRLK